jgi:hypothetical protein
MHPAMTAAFAWAPLIPPRPDVTKTVPAGDAASPKYRRIALIRVICVLVLVLIDQNYLQFIIFIKYPTYHRIDFCIKNFSKFNIFIQKSILGQIFF